MYYYINGKFKLSHDAKIAFDDSGFLYGDGLFETLRFDNQKLFSPEKHLCRLFKGLEVISLNIEQTASDLLYLLNKVIHKNKLDSGIVRLMITRGASNAESHSFNIPRIYISIKPFYDVPSKPVKVIYLDETKYPIIRFTPAIKSMNYIGNLLSKRECTKQGGYEPVFYNNDKIITECAIRNIFYIKNNTLLTPSTDLGILSGVMRDTIIDISKHIGVKVVEKHIDYNSVNDMHESFISSTGIGLLPCYWEGWKSNYKITKLIKKELFKRIKNS
ncbi:MAG: hypothetical protein CMG66_05245 [Candidatus Marinimicrobia bacterium]|nr:hypothetical protein [Candidatus Neomarinimicrobiota bacterium]|tara:strand:+ start:73477 stop:74298 length:822 start_codon:yes stop_codon:yes gene_type:complete